MINLLVLVGVLSAYAQGPSIGTARIREMWSIGMWPQKWSSDDIKADVPIDRITTVGDQMIVQPLLVR